MSITAHCTVYIISIYIYISMLFHARLALHDFARWGNYSQQHLMQQRCNSRYNVRMRLRPDKPLAQTEAQLPYFGQFSKACSEQREIGTTNIRR